MAKLPPPDDRGKYRPSGRINLLLFVPLVVVAVVVAATGATLIYLSGFAGLRFVIMTPLILTLPAMGMMYVACKYGKCRNRAVAFVVGFLVGAVVSPGRYHAEIVDILGVEALHRVDFLPSYLEARMMFKTMGKVGQANAGPQPAGTVDQVFNWVIFAAEVLIATFSCGIIAAGAASKPFDETSKTWMPSKQLILPSGASENLIAALQSRDKEKLAEELDRLGQAAMGICTATIHYSPESLRDGEEPLGYLTATESGLANKEGHRAMKTIFEYWKLDPDEVRRIEPILSDAPRPRPDDEPREREVIE